MSNQKIIDIKTAEDAFKKFSQEFGPDDVYTRILIEVVIEEILKISKEKQNGRTIG
jgi:hypothetical protein